MEKELETKKCECEECHCDEEKECNCGDNCNCNEEGCHCGNECNCDDDCHCECGDECNCDEEHNCGCLDGEECSCGDDYDCEDCDCNYTEELENKVKELEDRLLREKAEMINYRKRKDEDVARMLKFGNEDLVTEMLPIIDNFESAIKMDDDNLEDEVSKFLTGFKMIYCNLISILEKYDVKVIDGNNKPFDPTYHQAVIQEKSDLESGMVIEVLRKGYILKDKVIRPAMVKVSE